MVETLLVALLQEQIGNGEEEKDVGWRFSWLVLGKFLKLPEEDGRLWY